MGCEVVREVQEGSGTAVSCKATPMERGRDGRATGNRGGPGGQVRRRGREHKQSEATEQPRQGGGTPVTWVGPENQAWHRLHGEARGEGGQRGARAGKLGGRIEVVKS